MDEGTDVERALVAAGLLPESMPSNYTSRKSREVLAALDGVDEGQLREAVAAVKLLELRGPLAVAVFIKHHLGGVHEVEIDRVEESEEGRGFAVLVYPEGEVPVRTEHMPEGVAGGSRLRYDPSKGRYETAVAGG